MQVSSFLCDAFRLVLIVVVTTKYKFLLAINIYAAEELNLGACSKLGRGPNDTNNYV